MRFRIAASLFLAVSAVSGLALASPPGPLWTVDPVAPRGRNLGVLVAIGGKLYANGGNGNPAGSENVDIFDPSANAWTTGAHPSPQTPIGAGAVVVGNGFWLLGGATGVDPVTATEFYSAATDTWDASSPAPSAPHVGAGAAVIGNTIYLMGGTLDGNFTASDATAEVEKFDLTAKTWSLGTPMQTARMNFAAVALNGRIYAIGGTGTDGGRLSSVEAYDPVADAWSFVASLPEATKQLAAVADGNKIVVTGGSVADPSPGVCSGDEATPCFVDIACQIVPVGGTCEGVSSGVTRTSWSYVPGDAAWKIQGELNVERAGHAMAFTLGHFYAYSGANDAGTMESFVDGAQLFRIVTEAAGVHCAEGGQRIDAGNDLNGNGVLSDGEVNTSSYVCNGATGAAGTGASGAAGAGGANGINGADGAAGAAGTAGASCTVKQNSDGGATITCPDGSTATVSKAKGGCASSNGGLASGLCATVLLLLWRRKRD